WLAASGVVAAGVALDRVEARARVECGETTVVREASIEAARGDERFGASAEAVTVGQVVEVRGAVVEGLGQPIRAEMRRDALGLRANVDAPRIDLARAARLLGKERDVTEGTLSIRGDVDLQRTDAQGSLRARAEHVTVRS